MIDAQPTNSSLALVGALLLTCAFVGGVVVGAVVTWPMATRAAVLTAGPVCPAVLPAR